MEDRNISQSLTDSQIKVLLVDDQSLVRRGLAVLLSSEADLQIVGEASNGVEACEIADQVLPHVILMDLRMPKLDGVAATEKILLKHPGIKILVLTTFDDDAYLLGSLKAGACGYLLKDTAPDQLAAAIRFVHGGNSLMSAEIMSKVVSTIPNTTTLSKQELLKGLTEREISVLELMVLGQTNPEIALNLSLTEGTVKNYVTKILSRLGARDRIQAILMMQKNS